MLFLLLFNATMSRWYYRKKWIKNEASLDICLNSIHYCFDLKYLRNLMTQYSLFRVICCPSSLKLAMLLVILDYNHPAISIIGLIKGWYRYKEINPYFHVPIALDMTQILSWSSSTTLNGLENDTTYANLQSKWNLIAIKDFLNVYIDTTIQHH